MSTSAWTGAVNSDWADADNWSPGAGSEIAITGSNSFTQTDGSTTVAGLLVAGNEAMSAYTLTDLGVEAGNTENSSFAYGINSAGQVVGVSSVYATLWSGDSAIDLGGLSGSIGGQAQAINNLGQVVGESNFAGGGSVATLRSGSGTTDLGVLSGYTNSFAYGVNDAGEVVGRSDGPVSGGFTETATLRSGRQVINLGGLPGKVGSYADAINNAGQVVGASGSSSDESHATLWNKGIATDLGVLPGDTGSVADAINNSGQAVGFSVTNGGAVDNATLWSGGAIIRLGALPGSIGSIARAINDGGQVVGQSANGGGGLNYWHAILWSGGNTIDLNSIPISDSAGWILNNATAINDRGQIAGYGINPSGQYDAFLLTPVSQEDLWNGTGGWNLDAATDWSLGSAPTSAIPAEIETGSATISTSGAAGLLTIDSGATLNLDDGTALSVSDLLYNAGTWSLGGGDTATIGGTLINSNHLHIGNVALSASDEVTAAAVDNTGLIELMGSSANQALLNVSGSAGFGTAGVLSGHVRLVGDSAVEFASGEITSLAANAGLHLNGSDAFIEDSKALGSNSALMGLASIGAGAVLGLHNEATVSTTASLVNDGRIRLDIVDGDGGSSLTVAETLTNSGILRIGNTTLSASDKVTAASLENKGRIYLTGAGTNLAALDVSGATTNNGSISIAHDTEELAGAVGGKGSFSLSNANLLFESSVSGGQRITETGADSLILDKAQSFAATIRGFGTHAANFLLSRTRFNFVENSGGTGGTLTLHDGSLTANIRMAGHYSNSDFSLVADSGTGALVKFV
jgi:probable HAF family extracellular repeat protein